MSINDSTINTMGIVFPFLPEHVNRFFNDGKTVFVKFYGKERIPIRLHVGSTLFFYKSEGSKSRMDYASYRS